MQTNQNDDSSWEIDLQNPQLAPDSILSSERSSETRQMKSNSFEISNNVFKGFVGIGVLTLGYGISKSGIILGTILMIIGGIFTYWSVNLLILLIDHQKVRIPNYSHLAFLIFGKPGKYLTHVIVIVLQIGTALAYLYYLDVFIRNISCYYNWESVCNKGELTLLVAFAIIAPISSIKTLTRFNKLSIFANLLILITLILSIIYFINKLQINGIQGKMLFEINYFPMFFGVALFSIESMAIVLELRDSMQDPKLFKKIFKQQFIIILIMYTMIPIFFYIVLGSEINEVILFNIPIDTTIGMISQISYAIVLCISFTLQMFPIFFWTDNLFKNPDLLLLNQSKINKITIKLKQIFIRILISGLLVILTLIITDLVWYLNVLGAISSTILGIIMPVMLAEQYFFWSKNKFNPNDYSKKQRWLNLSTMMIGIAGGILATQYSFRFMVGKP